jgi:hypothetical protein
MRRTRCLALLCLSLAACSTGDGILLVHVGATAPVNGILSLEVSATSTRTGAVATFAVPSGAGPISIPPETTFALRVPEAHVGPMRLVVDAKGANGQSLSVGSVDTEAVLGTSTDVNLTLGVQAMGDGGTDACVPKTCEQTAVGCGMTDDGCGKSLDCGPCHLTALSPAIANSGDTVILEGNFVPATLVNFPGAAPVAAAVLGPHRATVIVPAAATRGIVKISALGQTVGGAYFRRATFPVGARHASLAFEQTTYARWSPVLLEARRGHTAVATHRFLHVIGGVGPGGPTASVEQSLINEDGTISVFSTVAASSLIAARVEHAQVQIANLVHVLGGRNQATVLKSIETAPINAEGKLGTFQAATASLQSPRAGLAAVTVGNWVYAIGGDTGGGPSTSVERAFIGSDGTLGPFAVVPGLTLNVARSGHLAFVVGRRLYVIGGGNAMVERAAITADGNLGPFEAAPGVSLSTDRRSAAGFFTGSALVIFGGTTTGASATAERATVDVSGDLSPFALVPESDLVLPRSGHTITLIGNYLFVLGGSQGATLLPSMERVNVNVGSQIGPLAVAANVTLQTARAGHSLVVIGDRVYALGGADTTVERAIVDEQGALGNFATVPGVVLSSARSLAAAVVSSRRLALLGGRDVSNQGLASIDSASILDTGDLQNFAVLTGSRVLVAGRRNLSALAYGNSVYVFGGRDAGGIALSSAERSPLSSSGDLNSGFVASTALPGLRTDSSVMVQRSNAFLMGGRGTNNDNTNSSDRIPLMNDGSLGSPVAHTTTAVPLPLSALATMGTFVVAFGGSAEEFTGQVGTRNLQRAAIGADGSPANVTTINGPLLNVAVQNARTITIHNTVYITGGATPTGLRQTVEALEMR